MQVITIHEFTHLLRFDRGEEVLSVLKKYCQDNDINAGYFSAIGACQSLELAWYHLDTNEYTTKLYEEMMEIASVTGNISVAEKKHIIHAHGVFSTIKETVAAHIKHMTVGVTCEVILHILPTPVTRQYNKSIGLALLSKPPIS